MGVISEAYENRDEMPVRFFIVKETDLEHSEVVGEIFLLPGVAKEFNDFVFELSGNRLTLRKESDNSVQNTYLIMER